MVVGILTELPRVLTTSLHLCFVVYSHFGVCSNAVKLLTGRELRHGDGALLFSLFL